VPSSLASTASLGRAHATAATLPRKRAFEGGQMVFSGSRQQAQKRLLDIGPIACRLHEAFVQRPILALRFDRRFAGSCERLRCRDPRLPRIAGVSAR